MNKSKFLIISYITPIALSFIPVSCNLNENTNENQITVKDMGGREVTINKNPKNVACISRTTYDLLVAFGLEKNIKGVFKTIKNNSWTKVFDKNIDKRYSLNYFESAESLLTKNVDLVFSPENKVSNDLEKSGIKALTCSLYAPKSYEEYVFYFADLVSKIWDDKEVLRRVNLWKERMTNAINQIKNKLKNHHEAKKTIYYVRGDRNNGINYTDNKNSFIEYAYQLLKLDYVGNRFKNNRPSKEEIIKINLDIISVGGIYQHTLIEEIKKETQFKAVKNNQLFNIPLGLTMFEQLNVFSSAFLYDQANKIYPNIFNFDVKKEIKELSETFFNINLSNLDIENILKGLTKDGKTHI